MGFTLNQLEQERQIKKLQKKGDKDTTNYEQLSNLPRINDIELKGNKTGSDLGVTDQSDIATEFNETTAYTAGCFVYHDGQLYIFNADHAIGAWDPSEVAEVNVTDQIVSNKAAIDALDDDKADKTDLSDMIPRTASGTTLAQLISAVNQLSTEQKHRCSIYINDNRTLTYTANNYFACMVVTGSTYAISQYRFDPTGDGSYARYINGGTTPDTQTITKWSLYYQGSPITL